MDRDGSSGISVLDGLSLTVTDPTGNSETESFSISVDDINDMAPVFGSSVYTANFKENSDNGTFT